MRRAGALRLLGHFGAPRRGPLHIEMALVILILVIVRHGMEIAGRIRAGKSLNELRRLLPDHVRVLQEGRAVVVSRNALKIGDHVCALKGHRFVSDGRIVEGNASVDEGLITGDARPVNKAVALKSTEVRSICTVRSCSS